MEIIQFKFIQMLKYELITQNRSLNGTIKSSRQVKMQATNWKGHKLMASSQHKTMQQAHS